MRIPLVPFVVAVSLILAGPNPAVAAQEEIPGWMRDDAARFPTFPSFDCADDAYCNEARERGLHAAELYGRGAAFADIDGDGWDDLFLANSDNRWDPDNFGISMFFMNERDGTFRPVPATELGISSDDLVANWNGSFADYDNDGDPDLLLANGGYSGASNLALYENRIAEGEGFVSVTDRSGIAASVPTPQTWWGSSWADYDNDGLLDVVVTRTTETAVLFHNDGDGRFTDASADLGVGIPMVDGKNPVWIDYDQDGDPDLYLAGMYQHAFYRNDAGESFEDVTAEVFSTPFPYPGHWPFPHDPTVFAAAAGDFDQDGVDDLYLGRWTLQDLVLFNDGEGNFRQRGADIGLTTKIYAEATGDPEPWEDTMGLGIGDLFDDGYPDVWIGTGLPPRAAPDIVFCNDAGESFTRCTSRIISGLDAVWRTRSHGTAFSDFDRDGDTDVVVNLGGNPAWDRDERERISPEWPALFVNRTETGPTATLILKGTESNRDAIGARIRVDGQPARYYTVRSMQAFQSQNSRAQVIPLGEDGEADVQIRWPSGTVQTVRLAAGERREVVEGAGATP